MTQQILVVITAFLAAGYLLKMAYSRFVSNEKSCKTGCGTCKVENNNNLKN